jgi:hypothetical protein
MRSLLQIFLLIGASAVSPAWGFFAHQKICWLAVTALPSEMAVFYKKHVDYLVETSINPDRRRYAVENEAPRHYIDLDEYSQSDAKLPERWPDAVKQFGEDSLMARGIVPWHVHFIYFQLRDAFLIRDPRAILRLSAELSHYVSDAHVPLHTTSNYDGQQTQQHGIHALWESRLPELFYVEYSFFVGGASYISDVQREVWKAVYQAAVQKDTVLLFERKIYQSMGDEKFGFEERGKQTAKVVNERYARAYHQLLKGMVEKQMRASVKMTADLWYTAWIDAGQPDLKTLLRYRPTPEEVKQRKEDLRVWKEYRYRARPHDE